MYIVNYWTNQYYDKWVWDKYYCKSLAGAKKKIISLLKEEGVFLPSQIKQIINPLSKYILDTQTMMNPWQPPNLVYKTYNVNYEDLYISITKEKLI